MADKKSLDIGSKKWQYGRSPAQDWLDVARCFQNVWQSAREEVVKMKRVVRIVNGVKIWEDDMIKEPKVGMRVEAINDKGMSYSCGDRGTIKKVECDGVHLIQWDEGMEWYSDSQNYKPIKEGTMKTLTQKIADAITTSRQKWVKYPKEVVKSNDPCGFCEEFGVGAKGSYDQCSICKPLFWGGESCMCGVRDDCDSTDDYWAEACDIMQAKFDKIEADYAVWGKQIRKRVVCRSKYECDVCGVPNHEEYILNDEGICKSCLDKIGIDTSEWDVKETPSKNATECSKHPSRGLCSDDCANYVPKHASEVEKSVQVKKEVFSAECEWVIAETGCCGEPRAYPNGKRGAVFDGCFLNEYIRANLIGKRTKLTIEIIDD